MDEYRHHVSGFFADAAQAEQALARLAQQGLPRARLHLFEADAASPVAAAPIKSNAVLKDMLVDGAIGTAVGTGVGALAQIALVAANVSLFIASPLVAPLVMLGWGASLGGLMGAAAGAGSMSTNPDEKKPLEKEGKFSALISDAISSGQVVLVAETRSERETALAREVIQAAVGVYKDVSTA